MVAREDDAVRESQPAPMRDASATTIAVIVVIDAMALVSSVIAWTLAPGDLSTWAKGALLVALALGFDEVSRRAARLRIRLSGDLRTDMTSVWAVAAAAALPRGVAIAVLVATFGYDWFRHHRPAGESLHRKICILATILLGCLAASVVSHAVMNNFSDSKSSTFVQGLAVLSAIVVYTVVQRALVTACVLTLGIRGRVLLGSRDDNLIELATLCLGGLVTLALDFEPILAVLALAPMITLHRGALLRELETAAATDVKTGLLNAVAWEHLAQREIARATREDTELAVLIIDIDHFKHVNDQFGHLVGDMVLRGIGRELGGVMRDYDTAGRFGGEEFVVVLPNAALGVAAMIAERIRVRINAVTVSDLADGLADDAAQKRLAVSVGVAMLHEHGEELTELLQAADMALYRAKAAGRNRVMLADRDVDGTSRETVGA